MAKNQPGWARGAMGQQEAALRRGAPGGKQFIGGKADQSRAAREAERRRVERMAEIDRAHRVAEELGTPLSAILADLVQDAAKLARTLALAPFRVALALVRGPRTA